MKKITNILLKIVGCLTLRGVVEKPKSHKQYRVKYVDYNTEDYIKIPLNGRSLKDMRITINDESFDLKSEFGDITSCTIATKPLTEERYWENWSVYSPDDEELIKEVSPTYIELMNSIKQFPAVYKLDNGNYDVFIRIISEDNLGYCGHVIKSNEPKNYPVGRYSERWNLSNMSKVINYGE